MNQVIFEFINSLSRFGFIKSFSLFLSYIFPYVFALILIVWSVVTPKKFMNLSLVFITSGFSYLASLVLKNIFKVARPVLENPIITEIGYSFPSSHATVAMAASVVVFHFSKTWGSVLIFISILIGLSRVVIGVHYPVDILTGWIVGALVAMASVYIVFKII